MFTKVLAILRECPSCNKTNRAWLISIPHNNIFNCSNCKEVIFPSCNDLTVIHLSLSFWVGVVLTLLLILLVGFDIITVMLIMIFTVLSGKYILYYIAPHDQGHPSLIWSFLDSNLNKVLIISIHLYALYRLLS
jgi:hypothetical protein